MASQQQKILLTGATGFIGGTVLTHLLESKDKSLKDCAVTCLVRGEHRVSELESAYGNRVHPVVYEGLDDIARTTEIAAQHDVVIGTTHGFHLESSLALVRGLALRKKQTGRDVYMIHTSGTSNLGDQRISGEYVEPDPSREFDDVDDDIYEYEKMRNQYREYDQRTVELRLIDESLALGVKTVVIMSPMIYGVGRGKFNVHSVQIPYYVRATLESGSGLMLGDGMSVIDHVHVEDVADLYVLVLQNIIAESGAGLAFGKKGIMFSGTGRSTWKEIGAGVAEAAFKAGKIQSPIPKPLSLQEAADLLCDGNISAVEINLSTNARTKASLARKLGWTPKKGSEAWKVGFEEEISAAIDAPQQKTGHQLGSAYRKID